MSNKTNDSDFKAEIVEVKSVIPHPNADRLDLLTVKGWQCVAQKGIYKVGAKVVYVPIDSILPEELEAIIFGPNSKVKLHKHRVRTIKLRGAISQGLVVPVDSIPYDLGKYMVGQDITEVLGITKYEPPAPKFQSFGGQSSAAKKTYIHPNFSKYHKWPNIKNYPELFKPEDIVVVTEKLHGTNFRAGWLKFKPNKWYKKLQMWLGLAPEWQFVYGSHNVQLSEKLLYKGFYDKNVYASMCQKYNLKEKIPKGMVIYGEVYGQGIQKGYTYGVEVGQELRLFDAKLEEGEYLSFENFTALCLSMSIKQAPVLYVGPYSKFDLTQYISGGSTLTPDQRVREGCVIKTVEEEKCYAGTRKGTKCINPEYLLKDNTDYH